MPDLSADPRAEHGRDGHASVAVVLLAHRRTLLTLGVAVVVISASRSVRNGLLPLWADHVGISASTTSLIFALAAAIDIAFFYPGGWLMDHCGRAVVAVPGRAVGRRRLLPAAVHLRRGGVGGRDGADRGRQRSRVGDRDDARCRHRAHGGRSQYLGGWRLCGDIGNTGGPLLVGAVARSRRWRPRAS